MILIGHPCAAASYNGHKETVRALLAHNANINHKIDLVQRFENYEDSPAAESIYASMRDHYGKTALGLAVLKGHATVIQLLVQAGATVIKKDVFNIDLKWNPEQAPSAASQSVSALAEAANVESSTPARTAEDAENEIPEAKRVRTDDAS